MLGVGMSKKRTKSVKTISDAKNYPYTLEDIAKAVGMYNAGSDKPMGSFRVWKTKQSKQISNPPSSLCIKNPDRGNELLFSEEYLKLVKAARGIKKSNSPVVTSKPSRKSITSEPLPLPTSDQIQQEIERLKSEVDTVNKKISYWKKMLEGLY
jgi:hypothetical protein